MRRAVRLSSLVLALGLAAGCYLSHQRADAPDGGPGATDAGPRDGGARDAGFPDAGPPRDPRWVELATDSGGPPARMNHFAFYDGDRDRMVVLGGFDPYLETGGCCRAEYVYYRDVWQLDLRSERWSQIGELERPLLSIYPTEAALDAPRRRVVIVGAVVNPNFGPIVNVALDLDRWGEAPLPAGPWPSGEWPLRAAHDAAAHRIVVHDAMYTAATLGLWVFDLTRDRWSTVEAMDAPIIRYHTQLIAAGRDRYLMYAGYGHPGERTAELWALDLDGRRWSPVPLVDAPDGRWSHRVVFDAARDRLVVYGGMLLSIHQGTLFVDLGEPSTEDPHLDPEPDGRRDHSMVFDSRRRRALVFGGAHASDHTYGDTWALELP